LGDIYIEIGDNKKATAAIKRAAKIADLGGDLPE
jgi:hypothetical protein